MLTKDQERTEAFRAWAASRKSRESAREQHRISQRNWQRMWAGDRPPPPRLLEELADAEPDAALADQLRTAAQPAEVTHA